MMYAAAADMIAAFGEDEVIACTDRPNLGEIDAQVLDAALVSACSEADSYLARRYALPLLVVPAALTSVVCDIARYRLTGGMASETDPIRDRYKLAIAWLADLASGKVSLPELEPPATDDAAVSFGCGRRVFADSRAGEGDD